MKSHSLFTLTLSMVLSLFPPALRCAEPMKQMGTIPLSGVNGRFDHFSIDTTDKRLFVAALGNDTVEVIDLEAGKRIQSITRTSKPQGVLFASKRTAILVANGGDGSCKILDGSDYKLLHNIPGLPDADNLRLHPRTGMVWLGYGDGALSEIAITGHKVLTTIKLPAHPESFQLESSGNRIFINVPEAKQIAVVDSKTRKLIDKWPMENFQGNFPMALDESNHRLFVGCRKPSRLVVLDTESGKPVADVALSGDTDDLFYDAKRKRVYASCGEGFLDVISQELPNSYKPEAKIPTSPGARTCFFSGDLDRLYLAVPEHESQKPEIRVFEPQ